MTFTQITTRVQARTNLTSTDSTTRIQQFINERYRAIVTSCNLGRCRRGSASVSTVASTATLTVTTLIKPITITLPAQNRTLAMRTLDQLRSYDPGASWSGAPAMYAVTGFTATGFTLEFRPIPDAIYALTIDGLIAGTDLSAAGDIPAFPEDFHDALIFGATADEYDHMDKPGQAAKMEKKFEERVADLRFFIQKEIYLHRAQGLSGFESLGWWMLWGAWGG